MPGSVRVAPATLKTATISTRLKSSDNDGDDAEHAVERDHQRCDEHHGDNAGSKTGENGFEPKTGLTVRSSTDVSVAGSAPDPKHDGQILNALFGEIG